MQLILVLDDIRSCHNVGSILRTCDGLGVKTVYLCGITPYPVEPNDTRLPHIANKIHAKITKTSLGAEKSVDWVHEPNIKNLLNDFREKNWTIIGLEQLARSTPIRNSIVINDTVLVLGSEVHGLSNETQLLCDEFVEIPMKGKKESLNVAVAAAIAVYQLVN